MARLSKEKVKERESHMKEIFERDPTLSAEDANKLFADTWGSQMRSSRVYEIRDIVRAELKDAGKLPASLSGARTSAPPKGGDVPAQAKGARQDTIPADDVCLLKIHKGEEETAAMVIAQLHDRGFTRARVDHEGPGYIVVTND